MLSAKTGRPPLENPRNQGLHIRLTSDEKAEIQTITKLYGCTVLDLIKLGIEAIKKK